MSIALILIPLALVLLAVAIWAFFWAVDSGQFDDLKEAGASILEDEATPARNPDKERLEHDDAD